MTDPLSLKKAIDDFDARFRQLSLREAEASFAMYRGLEHEDLNQIESEMSALWQSPEVVNLSETPPPSGEFERPLFLLKKGVLRSRVEGREEIYKAKNEANKMIVEYKIELDGKPISVSDLGQVTRFEKDWEKRKRAANVYIPLETKLHEKVLDLIDKRNASAKELGFKSYPHLVFHIEELDLDLTIEQMEDILERGSPSFQALVRNFATAPDVTPGKFMLISDLMYIHENYLPNLPNEKFPKVNLLDGISDGYRNIGLNLDELPIQTVIQDIPAGGFCFSFDPGKDIRILANPRDGHMWYQTMFHEFGHAVHGSFAKGDGRYFVALSDPALFWEGIAVTFEKLSMRRNFLRKYVDDPDAIEKFMSGAKKRQARRIRMLCLTSLFEFSLYLDPAPYDMLRKRLADMIRKYLFVEPACDPPTFTHDIFHITHPCYLQNYVVAEMIASQLFESATSSNGDPWNPEFAKEIVDELLVPGGSKPWREKLRTLTGKSFSPDALISDLYY